MAAGPLVVIVGPTASGKSDLAMKIAEKHKGEIICADSRTVYRGMDIGTAKPSKEDQKRVRHHLLDILEPNEPFNVGRFKQLAEKTILDIEKRGKLPVMVGGTGLYIDSVIFDYQFSGPGAEKDEVNPRHLKKTGPTSEPSMRSNTLVIGMDVEPEKLKTRIDKRIENMIENGLEQEVKRLSGFYGWVEPITAVGYQEWRAYFEGQNDLNKTRELITIHTRQYAKRQRTWFKRGGHIYWVRDSASALAYLENWFIESNNSGHIITTTTAP